MNEKRQFPRLVLPEDAIALDETGQRLGLVAEASGGGMRITADSIALAQKMEPGRQMRITVLEPASNTTHTVNTVVRYRNGGTIGLEFVGGQKS